MLFLVRIADLRFFLFPSQKYTHCEPDNFTNGTYAVMAQMTYLGPEDIFDMRGIYDYCLAAMSLAKDCEYGGWFDEINLWPGSPNNSQLWNVKARPIVGPCPDCTGGLFGGGGSRGAKCRGCLETSRGVGELKKVQLGLDGCS